MVAFSFLIPRRFILHILQVATAQTRSAVGQTAPDDSRYFFKLKPARCTAAVAAVQPGGEDVGVQVTMSGIPLSGPNAPNCSGPHERGCLLDQACRHG